MASFIRSERNKRKLIDEENYVYDKHVEYDTKTYWRCELFYKGGCRARVHTTSGCDSGEITFRSGVHQHPSNSAAVNAKKTVSSMKDQIYINGTISTREVMSSTLQFCDENSKSELPATETISRNIRNWRNKKLAIPALPKDRTGFSIPDSFKYLKDGSLFLVFDSGIEDSKRILVFATENGLNDIEKSTLWACDGTFKTCPTLWYQLITIHASIQNKLFPRIFSLLRDKTPATYTRLFSALQMLPPNCAPSTCVMDFEKGLHSSFTSVFLDSAIAGCLFHLGQSCWRKICELGQREKYNTNADFAIKIKCFTALAFVPPEHVVTSFEELSDDEEVPAEFVAYFESTYIGILRGRGANHRRDRPSFPVEMWNVRARTLEDMPRTNNAAEGFHSAL